MKIVEPADAAETPGSTFVAGRLRRPIRKPGEAVKLLGEALRRKSNPSVTEILQQRIRELPAEMARDVAMALADWDPKAAVPVLVGLTENLPPPQARDVATGLAGFDAEAALPVLRRLTQEAGRDRRPDKTALCERPPWLAAVRRSYRDADGDPRSASPEGICPMDPHRAERTGR